MKTALLLTLVVLTALIFLAGCTDSQLEDYSINEAPGIRITGEAMEAISNNKERFSLSYTERVS